MIDDTASEGAASAGVLRDALKVALPELESELEQREHSGNAAAIEPARTIIVHVRNAIGGDQR